MPSNAPRRSKEELVSRKLKLKILERDNYTCKYCGKSFPMEKLTIDHIRPVCLGGDSRESNLTTACWRCNNLKGTKRIRGLECEEDKKELDERYREKVRSYGYYTNYIKKVFSKNEINMSRPQIDKFVKANIKTDEDFAEFKKELYDSRNAFRIMMKCKRRRITYKEYKAEENSGATMQNIKKSCPIS